MHCLDAHLAMQGSLTDLSLTDLLQTVAHLDRLHVLVVSDGRRNAVVALERDQLMGARCCDGTTGLEAFGRVLDQRWTRFSVLRIASTRSLPPIAPLAWAMLLATMPSDAVNVDHLLASAA